jgi:hypothetical protein
VVRVVRTRINGSPPGLSVATLTDKSVGLDREILDYSADRDVVGSIPSDINQFSNLQKLYAHDFSLVNAR